MWMRAYHRWFGLPAALFMIFLAVTGLALQIDLWITGNPVPGSEEPPPPRQAPLPPTAEVGRLAAASITIARARRPDMVVQHVDLSFTPGGVRATVGGAGPFAEHLTLDPRTGVIHPERRMSPGWHNWLQNLHAGYAFGFAGRLVSVALALSLLVLGVSGLMIYFDLYRRRYKAGRSQLFWKR